MQICKSIENMYKLFGYFLLLSMFFNSCTSSKVAVKSNEITSLKFLSEYDLPFNTQFQNTTTGGLSGIDYDRDKNIYYLICDDRSQLNPARFYTIAIDVNNNKIDSVSFINTTFLKNKTGNFYPSFKENRSETPDPEALRFNPVQKKFIWSSEGERIVNARDTTLQNPSVTEIDEKGNYLDTFQLPQQLHMQATENGPRQNGVFEGLTFSNNFKNLFVSVEEPLYNDGARAGIKDSGTIRIMEFDVASKKPIAAYAYKIDPVAHPAFPENAFKVNGIPDILWLNDNQFLAIERSFSTGRLSCTIKVYLANISSATNVLNYPSISEKQAIKFVSKKLLLNMDSLGIYIDNLEGVTFGPDLPGGKKSLIFVSDNNFNPLEKTQFLLFSIE